MKYFPSESRILRPFFQLYDKFINLVERAKLTEHTFVLVIAVIIGLLGGLGAVVIQYAIKEFQLLFWQGKFNLETISQVAWYWKILIPMFGGIVVGLVIQFFAKEAKGHGVPEVMEAIALRNGKIRPRVAIAKLFSSAFYIATGGSVGREGPVIQIGSAIGSVIGQFFRVNQKRMRVFVACGAASGIAAAFNAPVAGALFAVEIILGDFAVAQFSPIVISSVTATVVSRHFLGDFPAFVIPKYNLVSPLELVNYVILGFLAGFTAILFIKVLYASEDFFDKVKLPEYVKAGFGGIIIGAIALYFPQVFGVGYDTMDSALSGHLLGWLALALIFLKILATSISLGSGGSGGIFAPSLFLGAMLGTFFGFAVHFFFPEWTAESGAYALVAMGGVVGAATHGPITAILIIFELTNDYKIILPLMITTIIATLISVRFQKESIYTLKLVRKGINIFAGREVNVLRSLKVESVVKKSMNIVAEDMSFSSLLEKIVNSQHNYTYVVDKNKEIIGCISMTEIRQTITDYDTLKHLLIAKDIAQQNVTKIKESDNLDFAMKEFSRSGHDELPVIRNGSKNEIVGTISQIDVINTYNHQIFLRDMSGELGSSMQRVEDAKSVHVVDKYYFHEIEAPSRFIGRNLADLNIRNNYNLEAVLIKRQKESGGSLENHYIQPKAKTILRLNDTLLLFGAQTDFKRFMNAKI